MSEDPSKGAPKGSPVGGAEGPERGSLEKQWNALMSDIKRWHEEAEYAVAKSFLRETLKIAEHLSKINAATTGGSVHHVFIDIIVVLEALVTARLLGGTDKKGEAWSPPSNPKKRKPVWQLVPRLTEYCTSDYKSLKPELFKLTKLMKVLCLVRHNAIHYDGVKGLLSGIMDANRSEYEKIHDMREFKRECNTEIDEKVTLLCKNGTKLGFWSPDIVRRLLKLALDVLSLHKGKGTDDTALFLKSMPASAGTMSVADTEKKELLNLLTENKERFEKLGMKNDFKTLEELVTKLIDVSRCWFRVSRHIVERALRIWFKRMSRGGITVDAASNANEPDGSTEDATSDAKEPDYARFKNTIIDLGRNGLPEKNKLRLLDIVYAVNPSFHPAQDDQTHLMPARVPGEERNVVASYTMKNGTLLLKYARKELKAALDTPVSKSRTA